MSNERIGFSTGALEKADYRAALLWMREKRVRSVELSALRYDELAPLIEDLDNIYLDSFQYVSFHAPSSFKQEHEDHIVSLLSKVADRGWNIIVHPDVIYSPARWEQLGSRLLIENMDRRKATGRSVAEINTLLQKLPRARICLDLAHARQLDTTLTLLWSLTTTFRDRIAEIHISDLDSRCRHHVLSCQSVLDYQRFAPLLQNIPVIIESVLYNHQPALRDQELHLAREAMPSPC